MHRERPAFFADVMLGSLARWMRVLGFDTEYDHAISDDELIRFCLLHDRIALTRDRLLVKRRKIRHQSLLLRQELLFSQLREVLERMNLRVDPDSLFSRCLECNAGLQEVPKEQIRKQVPPYVFSTQEHFSQCPGCQRIFWAGTHRPKIMNRIQPLLDDFSVRQK